MQGEFGFWLVYHLDLGSVYVHCILSKVLIYENEKSTVSE